MHISDQVAAILVSTGWRAIELNTGTHFEKHIAGFAPAGSLSDGTRLVTLTMCETGRWLERKDGWNKTERAIDLRDYSNEPQKAIDAVLTVL